MIFFPQCLNHQRLASTNVSSRYIFHVCFFFFFFLSRFSEPCQRKWCSNHDSDTYPWKWMHRFELNFTDTLFVPTSHLTDSFDYFFSFSLLSHSILTYHTSCDFFRLYVTLHKDTIYNDNLRWFFFFSKPKCTTSQTHNILSICHLNKSRVRHLRLFAPVVWLMMDSSKVLCSKNELI